VPYENQSDAVTCLAALTAAGLAEDLDAALNHLAALGFQPGQVGAIGFCHGGGVALLAAARRDLSVGITFYGGGIETARYGLPALTDLAGSLKAPWLGLYGALDTSIPEAQLSKLESAAKSSGQPVELICYPDAGHGFFCEERASYNPEVSVDAWRRTLEWIDKYLDS
jgi:carboxymethylenebutenolidase